MDMEMVPERYMDIITREFAYDPVRLPLDQDSTKLLYNRKTLQTIWETEQHARNPLTRQWFDIKSAIPQTELREEMKRFIGLHRFPAETVIADYSKILDEREMKRHLMILYKSVEGTLGTETQWVNIWKEMNLVRLFCEFHSDNIKLFISLHGFRYLRKVICKTVTENDAKEAALDAGKEIVRAIDVVLNGRRALGENQFEENCCQRQFVILSLIRIVRHVYINIKNQDYVKIRSLVLRAFSTILHEIDVDMKIILQSGKTVRVVLMGYPCALRILEQPNANNISSEDLNHAIAILGRERVPPLNISQRYARALRNAVIMCICREIERSKETSGFTEGQLLEAEIQARHNSEALEQVLRLIRDISMDEGHLAACILTRAIHIVKILVYLFERVFTHAQNEDEVEIGRNRRLPVSICENHCEMVQCVHYRIARNGLDISEVISRKQGTLLDVEILRKFIADRTGE